MNSHLHTLAKKSMLWNTLESVCYQLIMCSHQMFLFYTAETQLYGFVGVLFSGIYTTVALVNIGLDTTLGAWWHEAMRSKKAFVRLVMLQYIPQLTLLIPAGIILNYLSGSGLPLLLLMIGIIMLESAKRTLKTCLYLQFANSIIAPTEVALLILYVSIVWIWIALSGTVTVTTILLPMLVSSAINVTVYGWHVMNLYAKLPEDTQADVCIPIKTVMSMRLTNYVTQVTHLLFSGNVLIPLFALRFGLATAGTLKLVNTLAYGVGTLMYKIVGTTSQALFAYTKASDHTESNAVFATCTNRIYQLIYLVGIFALINSSKMGSALSVIGILPALLFAAIIITENICNIYEQFLTIRNQGYYNALLQITSFLVTYGLLYQSAGSLSTVLILLLCVRIITLICFELIIRHYWHIKSDTRLEPLYGISALIVSLIIFWVW